MGLKKAIRAAIIDRNVEIGLGLRPDDVNAITNAVHRVVRPRPEATGPMVTVRCSCGGDVEVPIPLDGTDTFTESIRAHVEATHSPGDVALTFQGKTMIVGTVS